MKLAVAIFRYFPFGGLQRDMLAIAQEAHRRGHQVTVFCGAWQGEKIPGIDVVIINGKGFLNVAGVSRFVKAFQQEFQREQFDLLIGFNKMPGLDIYYCGDSCFAKKAYEERSFFYRLTPRAQLYLRYEEAVYSYLSKTQILEVSSAERRSFAKYYATQKQRQTLLPPGVEPKFCLSDVQRLRAAETIRTELQLVNQEQIILCVGSGFKTKGLDRSIAAFAQYHQQHSASALVVVGNGDSQPYRAMVERLGLCSAVKFLGGRSDMPELYAAANLLLHPAYKEVTGNVLLEAMLCAVPVLVTSVCGYAHYVVDYDLGQLIEQPDDAQATARQMMALLAVDKSTWRARAAIFASRGNIFSRPERAVELITQRAQQPQQEHMLCTPAGVVLCDELIGEWQGTDVFAQVKNLAGSVARAMPDRETLRFEMQSKTYYRKWHSGVGWREIIKNLVQLRLPVLGAKQEWIALQKLRALGIPSLIPVAFGERSSNPAKRESFIVTRELTGVIQLDHYFQQHSVGIKCRCAIIERIALMVRDLHGAGINHRDLYLCHFMVKPETLAPERQPDIYLIDLHRAQCRPAVPRRWRIKDLAALYYSAFNLGVSYRDCLRFLRVYFDLPAAELVVQQRALLNKVERRAVQIYCRDFGHPPKGF